MSAGLISGKTDETIVSEKRERPQETEETKGFFYGPNDNEPQSIEEIREIEEKLQRAKKAERRTFGEPAFQYFAADAAVLEGEGSLLTEAEPISETLEIDKEENEFLLMEIMDDPPVFHYGKMIYEGDGAVEKQEGDGAK